MKIKILSPYAKLPTRGSEYAAGYDLYACMDDWSEVTIYPGATCKIGTGIAVQVPHGYFGGIYPRSGLATKLGLRLANSVGVLDEDYTGEVVVALHNDSDTPRTVVNGDRIAQLIIQPYGIVEFEVVESLDETARGEGGFGSTGCR